ncbi:MAG: STAS domain-containing protein [bacterium]|nr:STAS domain-containing protein [bacterium]
MKHSLWSSTRTRRKIELQTDVSECGTFHLMSVHGRLTIDTSPDFVDEIRRVVRKASHLKVNLADVAYVDSSGISVLIQGLKLAQERSVDYTLLNPSPKVQAVIELSQLHNFFNIESSSGGGCAEPE